MCVCVVTTLRATCPVCFAFAESPSLSLSPQTMKERDVLSLNKGRRRHRGARGGHRDCDFRLRSIRFSFRWNSANLFSGFLLRGSDQRTWWADMSGWCRLGRSSSPPLQTVATCNSLGNGCLRHAAGECEVHRPAIAYVCVSDQTRQVYSTRDRHAVHGTGVDGP